jgi:hypothetical protein
LTAIKVEYEKVKSIYDITMAHLFAINPSFESYIWCFTGHQTRIFGLSGTNQE